MTHDPIQAGRIVAYDIEELNQLVQPWELEMVQVDKGRLCAVVDFAAVRGILITRERWDRAVIAVGTTPPGYFAIAGATTANTFKMCGVEIGTQSFVNQFDCATTEFSTPAMADHWVILVPEQQVVEQLGPDVAGYVIERARCKSGNPRVIQKLGALALKTVTYSKQQNGALVNSGAGAMLHTQLLDAIIELLTYDVPDMNTGTKQERARAALRAARHAVGVKEPVSVGDLASYAKVSRRSLEMGFREALDVSPSNFMKATRMTGMYKELKTTDRRKASVTDIAMRWGFYELGRTAVEYRRVFGEKPSETLSCARSVENGSYQSLL